MTKRFLNMTETVAIADKLREVAKRVEAGCEYAAGWNDERVAEAAGLPELVKQVSSVRQRLMGSVVRKKTPAVTSAELRVEIAALWGAVRALQGGVAGLEDWRRATSTPAAPAPNPNGGFAFPLADARPPWIK